MNGTGRLGYPQISPEKGRKGTVTNQVGVGPELEAALDGLDLDREERSILLERLSERTRGLMIYGSRARGDYLPTSDFDLLRLSCAAFPTFKVGRVSVSSYSTEQLQSATRTLFGTHLLRDGKILFDLTGELAQIIGGLKSADPRGLLQTVHRYSTILDQPLDEQLTHCPGLVRLARYLLRTAVYARAMDEGTPCFSVRELAERFSDPVLATLLASDPELTGPPSNLLFDELVARLVAIVGPPPRNKFGSLSALAVGTWESDRNLAALAVRAASEDEQTLDYSDLPKVLL